MESDAVKQAREMLRSRRKELRGELKSVEAALKGLAKKPRKRASG
jgi:hypothetical protein